MVEKRKSTGSRGNQQSRRRRKEFDRVVKENKRLILEISQLPLDAKGARVYPRHIINAVSAILKEFSVGWVSESFDVHSSVLYRWHRDLDKSVEAFACS
jgi:hypothetical protein